MLAAGAGVALAAYYLWQREQTHRAWETAQEALRESDLESASAHLDRYLKRRPDDTAAWFLAARTSRRRGRFAEAERLLEQCQKVGGVTDATRLEWSLLRVQRGDLGDIDVRLRATIGPDHPDASVVLEALAQGYLKCERLADAYEACELWRAHRPEDPGPWLWRGRLFEHIRNWGHAEEDFRRAVDAAPRFREARLALGAALLRLRRPDEAVPHFEHVLSRAPADPRALLGLAECRLEAGDADEAVRLLGRMPTEDASSAPCLFLQGRAYWLCGDYGGAEPWLRRAVNLAPDDADALHLLIQCLRARHLDAEADRLSERLASLRADLRRFNDLVKAIARGEDGVAERVAAGAIALRVGRPDEALRWFTSALRASGDRRAAHAALADYYAQNGDPARADAHRRLAEQR